MRDKLFDPLFDPLYEGNPIFQKMMDEITETVNNEIKKLNDGVIVEPNTIGIDFYFLMGFMTEEMFVDFPVIEQDFIKHCGDNLNKLNGLGWYDEAYVGINKPVRIIYQHVLRMIYNGAKAGDSYCIELIKHLYKTYHKKEYNQLKHFSELSQEDRFALSDCEQDLYGDVVYARIMVMARFFDIQLDEGCVLDYVVYEKKRKGFLQLVNMSTKGKDLKEECINDASIQIDKWLEEAEKNKKLIKTYKEINEFSNAMYRSRGFSDDYDKRCIDDFEGGRTHLIMTLALLKTLNPKREYSFEEVQIYTRVRDLIIALTDVSLNLDYEVGYLLGEALDEEIIGNSRFKPGSIKSAGGNQNIKNKVALNTAPERIGEPTDDDYLAVIADLRFKINKAERDNDYLRRDNQDLKKEVAKLRNLLSRSEAEHEDLIKLRDCVYESAKEDEGTEHNNLEKMKESLRTKRIIIIGGAPNWVAKLKKEFPKWNFVSPEASGSVDASVVNNADYVVLFSKVLKHANYYKYINVLREHGIEYGYIGEVNIDRNIRYIYEKISTD